VYPNGRELAFHFDALGHVKAITDLAERREIARYTYIGPNRVLERTYRNGVRLSYLDGQRRNQVGYDGVRRPVKVFHLRDNSSLVADFSYDYDRANNKLREFEATGEEREDYSYDSLYRLVRCERPVRKDLWALDGLSNWVSRNGLFNIANVVNEYDAFAGVTQVHDDNGNLIEDGLYRYQYDFANRICRVIGKTDDDVIAVYRYDAFNRRITSSSRNAHGFIETVEYRYDDWREIEEKRNNSMQQYVYGPGVDEQLTMDRYSGSGVRLAGTLFYHHDDRANVRLLTDEDGNIIERYSYDPYGSPVAPPNTPNPYLFAARRLDAETGLYYFRNRYFNPVQGRFQQRDPIRSPANAYEYALSNPVMKRDPLGLAVCTIHGHEECDVILHWECVDGRCWTSTQLENCHDVIDTADCSGNLGGVDGGGGDPTSSNVPRRCTRQLQRELDDCETRCAENCALCAENAKERCNFCAHTSDSQTCKLFAEANSCFRNPPCPPRNPPPEWIDDSEDWTA